ncbi:MAG: MFS transporter [Opitutales bacterium]|nr:MFS transporter [Opitutales bacterium]
MRLPALSPQHPFDPARLPFFYGWVVTAAATLTVVASIPGQTMGVSVFTDVFVEETGLTRLQLTITYLVGTAASAFLLPAGGRLFDRMGARWFGVLSCVAFGGSLAFMAEVDRVAAGLAGVLGGGFAAGVVVMTFGFFLIRFFGQGLVTLAARSVQGKWWNRRRGFVGGCTAVFVGFSFALAPLFLDWQIRSFGWRGAYLINAAVLVFFVGSIVYLFFRDNPEECGLEMDGGWRGRSKRVNPDLFWKRDFTLAEAYRTYSFWVISLMLGTNALVITAYTFHVVDIARDYGVERRVMLGFFAYAAMVSVPTNLLLGIIADHIRIRYIVMFVGVSGAVMGLGIALLPSVLGMVLLVVGIGCSGAGFSVVMNVSYPRYYGRAHIGAISGASMLFFVWGSAFGPLAYSAGHALTGSYTAVVLLGSAVYLTLAFGAYWANNPQRNL